MNSEKIKAIIESDSNCFIIKGVDGNNRPAYAVSNTIEQTGNKILLNLFPQFKSQKYFIETLYEILNRKFFNNEDEIVTYINFLKANSENNLKDCLYKNENEKIYFGVINDFWEKYNIIPLKEPNGKYVVPFSKIKKFQFFHPNQKIYLNPLITLSKEEQELLDKENLLIKLYDYEF